MRDLKWLLTLLSEGVDKNEGDFCISYRTRKGMRPGDPRIIESRELYIPISTIKYQDNEQALDRGVAECVQKVATVFDDRGTKCIATPIKPHISIVTSVTEGVKNYQDWYLEKPQVVTKLLHDNFNNFIKAAAKKKYTDKGATGVQRLVRFPGSWHEEKNFTAYVEEYNPMPRWDNFHALARAMGVEFKLKEVCGSHIIGKAANGIDDIGQWLMANAGGELRERSDGDLIAFECPFPHGNGRSDGAAYWLGGRNFSCYHDSCQGRKCLEYHEWIRNKGGPDVRASDVLKWNKNFKKIAEIKERILRSKL